VFEFGAGGGGGGGATAAAASSNNKSLNPSAKVFVFGASSQAKASSTKGGKKSKRSSSSSSSQSSSLSSASFSSSSSSSSKTLNSPIVEKYRGALDDVPDEVDWLFDMRSSELFLSLWRQIARQVLQECVPGAVELLAQMNGRGDSIIGRSSTFGSSSAGAGAAAENLGEDDEDDENMMMPDIPTELDGNEEGIRQFYTEHARVMAEARQIRQQQRSDRARLEFIRQDKERQVLANLETKVGGKAFILCLFNCHSLNIFDLDKLLSSFFVIPFEYIYVGVNSR
jgi:hypothetical protein